MQDGQNTQSSDNQFAQTVEQVTESSRKTEDVVFAEVAMPTEPAPETRVEDPTPNNSPVPSADEALGPETPESAPEASQDNSIASTPEPAEQAATTPEPLSPSIQPEQASKETQTETTPAPITEESPKIAEPTVTIPEPEPSKPAISPTTSQEIPQKVLDLTPEELDAARLLWARQNIAKVQAKSAHDRTARRNKLLDEMTEYIKDHAPATISMISYNLNISPRMASDCLRDLVPTGRVNASGNTTNRRYS